MACLAWVSHFQILENQLTHLKKAIITLCCFWI